MNLSWSDKQLPARSGRKGYSYYVQIERDNSIKYCNRIFKDVNNAIDSFRNLQRSGFFSEKDSATIYDIVTGQQARTCFHINNTKTGDKLDGTQSNR